MEIPLVPGHVPFGQASQLLWLVFYTKSRKSLKTRLKNSDPGVTQANGHQDYVHFVALGAISPFAARDLRRPIITAYVLLYNELVFILFKVQLGLLDLTTVSQQFT